MEKKLLLIVIIIVILVGVGIVWLTVFSGNEAGTFLGRKINTLTAGDVGKYTRLEGGNLFVDEKIIDFVRIKKDGTFHKYSDWLSMINDPEDNLLAPGGTVMPKQQEYAYCDVVGNPTGGGTLSCVQRAGCLSCSGPHQEFVKPDGQTHQGLLRVWCDCAE